VAQVRFRPEAVAEALAARAWYAKRSAAAGDAFAVDLGETVSHVAERPIAFPDVRAGIRRAVFRKFPYAVYYRVHDGDVVILAVHGRQDPKRWQSRR
jgi:plasmid stabilization system protein ParE